MSRINPPEGPTLSTPDITPAQLVAAVSAIIAQAVAFGLLDAGRAQSLVSVAGIIVPAIWTLADAWIRHGRAVGNTQR